MIIKSDKDFKMLFILTRYAEIMYLLCIYLALTWNSQAHLEITCKYNEYIMNEI